MLVDESVGSAQRIREKAGKGEKEATGERRRAELLMGEIVKEGRESEEKREWGEDRRGGWGEGG